MDNFRMPLIGEKAPEFKANTTYGQVNFPGDYKGKWVIFFSHPGDFTPVCTTEMMTFAAVNDQFAAKNAALLGLSVDSNPSHMAWVKAMEGYSWNGINHPKVGFPIIADDFGNVARLYGMLMPSASATKTVRNVYMIDPEATVRAVISYPLTTGRNIQEIFRLLLALQAYDGNGYSTPANWQPGDDQLYAVPQTMDVSSQRMGEQMAGGYNCIDWYMCFTKAGNKPAAIPDPVYNPPVPHPLMSTPVMPAPAFNPPVPQPLMATPVTPMQAAERAANNTNIPGVVTGPMIYEAQQPGRPFAPDGEMPGQMGEAAPKNMLSIMDENRNLLGMNRSTNNKSGNFLNDYLITRDNRPKKNM
jgi:peroxiredoxin (alkyl hydroperoxide reductase subunit C)